MRAVVQRVSRASVRVGGQETGRVEAGMLVLVAATHGDGPADVAWLVDKLTHLRIFEDDAGKMNRSLLDTGGAALIVSQFTLYGDCRKGRRPSFAAAAPPDLAAALIEQVAAGLSAAGVPTASGRFGAHMAVSLENDGPVTIILDSPPSGPPSGPATMAKGE